MPDIKRLALLLVGAVSIGAAARAEPLRVCADPENLPFSDEHGGGFENRIAALVAADLGRELVYAWRVERRGFVRRGLLSGECDMLLGAPPGLPGTALTAPYYRTSYVFVARHGEMPRSLDDPRLLTARIGVHALGVEGANTPPAMSLAERGIAANVTGFPIWGRTGIVDAQGLVVDAVAKGAIDVAMIWGPFGGYFAKRYGGKLEVRPIAQDERRPSVAYAYSLSIAVRRDDTALRDDLDRSLVRLAPAIKDVLAAYAIPLVAEPQPNLATE